MWFTRTRSKKLHASAPALWLRERIRTEANRTLDHTMVALQALEENNPEEARGALERVTGKMALIVAMIRRCQRVPQLPRAERQAYDSTDTARKR